MHRDICILANDFHKCSDSEIRNLLRNPQFGLVRRNWIWIFKLRRRDSIFYHFIFDSKIDRYFVLTVKTSHTQDFRHLNACQYLHCDVMSPATVSVFSSCFSFAINRFCVHWHSIWFCCNSLVIVYRLQFSRIFRTFLLLLFGFEMCEVWTRKKQQGSRIVNCQLRFIT